LPRAISRNNRPVLTHNDSLWKRGFILGYSLSTMHLLLDFA
jgi:hypothetical protein